MIVVTSGSRYIDIDAYASIIAYANFLNLKGQSAVAYSSSLLNKSVTTSLKNNKYTISTQTKFSSKDEFVILDVSAPDFFDKSVDIDRIVQIIDHHFGFEDYWSSKPKVNARIEKIGAVATIIFELYKQENLLNKLDKDMCLLLMAAILDNTLNFKAKVTTTRDKKAYKILESLANLDFDYPEFYFNECENEISSNLKQAILNDTKIDNSGGKVPPIFSQLTVWNAKKFLNDTHILYDTLNTFNRPWLMNIIALNDGKSFLISTDATIKLNIETTFNCHFNNDIAILPNLWLRKEILKKLL